jgi:threonine/homoserine/homoserine lactone efflux protein
VIQQIFFLGMIFILVTLLVFGGIALLAGAVGVWLTNTPRAQTIMNRIAGAVFVAMALKLVTANINT